MSGEPPLASSFRDPSGFLFRRGSGLYRQINLSYQTAYEKLLGSGLYQALTEEGWLLPHEETSEAPAQPKEAYRVIRPQPIPFISYPYEWCFSQLQNAALLTLKIQRKALGFGMSLKDASAYNVQFLDGRPVLIDTLSFEPYREGSPWIAYRQFCQHFLAPLALMSCKDGRLGRLLQLHLDGIPLDLADSLLPWAARWRPGLFLHLRLHAAAQRRFAETTPGPAGRKMDLKGMLGLLDHLEGTLRGLRWKAQPGEWERYLDQHSYGAEGFEHKKQVVEQFLDDVRPVPRVAWDLGANTGLFSRLASRRGIFTVAWEMDAGCVERNYLESIRAGERNLLPLVMDLTNPSPAVGWANRERDPWLERGSADLVLALAILHHLAIANHVPLDQVLGLMARAGRWLIIEFIPKEDPQLRPMLFEREGGFPDYTQAGFEKAAASLFSIRRSEPVRGTRRTLYLMERAA